MGYEVGTADAQTCSADLFCHAILVFCRTLRCKQRWCRDRVEERRCTDTIGAQEMLSYAFRDGMTRGLRWNAGR